MVLRGIDRNQKALICKRERDSQHFSLKRKEKIEREMGLTSEPNGLKRDERIEAFIREHSGSPELTKAHRSVSNKAYPYIRGDDCDPLQKHCRDRCNACIYMAS